MEGCLPRRDGRDLGRVHVDERHVQAAFREGHARAEADVARADDGDAPWTLGWPRLTVVCRGPFDDRT
jgi:hypothetical protein